MLRLNCEGRATNLTTGGSLKASLFLSTKGNVAYTQIPKCGCTTVKQYLYFIGEGRFYEGDVHDAPAGFLSWRREPALVRRELADAPHFHFTFVRNPYARLLSAFFDKVANPQSNGRFYGKPRMLAALKDYGVDPENDPVRAFRRFVIFVRDNILFNQPLPPNLHWAPMAWHAAASVRMGLSFDAVYRVENYESDLSQLLGSVMPDRSYAPPHVRRFNPSLERRIKRELPVAEYYDPTACAMMVEAFRDDFDVFGYAEDPAEEASSPLMLAEVNQRLQNIALRRSGDWLDRIARKLAPHAGRITVRPAREAE